MPYVLVGNCVHKQNEDKSAGELVPGGCHDSHAKALAHMRALYANVPDARGTKGTTEWECVDPKDPRCGVYLIHHAMTKLDDEGRVQGWVDSDLDKGGRKEAKKLGKEFRKVPLKSIQSSDLRRASHTAEIISKKTGVPYEGASKEYRTWNLGQLQAHEGDYANPIIERYTKQGSTPVPGGESFDDFRNRGLGAIARAIKETPPDGNESKAIVTHHRVMELAQAGQHGQFDVNKYMQSGIPKDGYIKLVQAGTMMKESTVVPPNLREATGKSACENCKFYDPDNATHGLCKLYSNYPVDADDVCDAWRAVSTEEPSMSKSTKENSPLSGMTQWFSQMFKAKAESPAEEEEENETPEEEAAESPEKQAQEAREGTEQHPQRAKKQYSPAIKAAKKAMKKAKKMMKAAKKAQRETPMSGATSMAPSTKEPPREFKPTSTESGAEDNDYEESEEKELGGHLVTDESGNKHLPTSVGGKPDPRHMGYAWAALHEGFRGNKYEGPDKEKAIAKLRNMYEAHGMTPPGGDEKKANKEFSTDFSVMKQEDGHYRWAAITSSGFRDRDNQLVTSSALKQDVERMNKESSFGNLRFWHHEFKEDNPQTRDPGIGIDLASCDVSEMVTPVSNLESGVFFDDSVGKAFYTRQKEFGTSRGFWYPASEPDAMGNFNHIYTFERSILPSSRASNLMSSELLSIQKETGEGKLAAFKEIVGEEAYNKMMETVALKERELESKGVEKKEKKPLDLTQFKDTFVTKDDFKTFQKEVTDALKMFGETFVATQTKAQGETQTLLSTVKELSAKVTELYGDAPTFLKGFRPSESEKTESQSTVVKEAKEMMDKLNAMHKEATQGAPSSLHDNGNPMGAMAGFVMNGLGGSRNGS